MKQTDTTAYANDLINYREPVIHGDNRKRTVFSALAASAALLLIGCSQIIGGHDVVSRYDTLLDIAYIPATAGATVTTMLDFFLAIVHKMDEPFFLRFPEDIERLLLGDLATKSFVKHKISHIVEFKANLQTVATFSAG
jgi:hypothetical protein